MRYIADLHIHSHYSRATSKASTLHGLAAWAAVKGIHVVGTGDFTHPGWFAHLQECLEPAEPGFFRLKSDHIIDMSHVLPMGIRSALSSDSIRFVLSAEISSIYKRDGKVRKVHNLLYVPDFHAARQINATLANLGNISADGRPILGLDSRILLEILLENSESGFLVPAHIWTPWFSLFGSKSGFDSIEECFGDLSQHIFALETGLSSDPEMNRMVSALDRFTLLSNSDCHSPAKLGREANIFNTGFDFFSLRQAVESPVNQDGQQVFDGTVEFYPEGGKYHFDGHRKCQICLEPQESRRLDGLCPTCGKPLTIGVLHRVLELADREKPVYPSGSPQVYSLVPLQEMIAELLGSGPASKKVQNSYVRLINTFGSEFTLLMETPIEEIRLQGSPLLAEAVRRVRTNRVIRHAGYDGEFGIIQIFSGDERARLCGQGSLFTPPSRQEKRQKTGKRSILDPASAIDSPAHLTTDQAALNDEQQQAVASTAPLILVQAGPGTGKTHTLVSRVRHMAGTGSTPCTVITFTNKAAAEVRERIFQYVAGDSAPVTVSTFHGYCLRYLRQFSPALKVAGPEERMSVLEELQPDWNARDREAFSRLLNRLFSRLESSTDDGVLQRYLQTLEERFLIDIEAVVSRTVELLRSGGPEAETIRRETGHLFVDEFQDVNAAQYALIALLAQTSTVFAIGDPDQSIYGFRGSDPKWFHTFRCDLNPEIHRLFRNYRSGVTIVRAAEQLIARNDHPLPLIPMDACKGSEGTVYMQSCEHPEHEAVFIADSIDVHVGGTSHRSIERFTRSETSTVSFRDIGVLYRTSAQSAAIGAVLSSRGIPFQVVDLEAYYTRGDCSLLYFWMLALAGLARYGQIISLVSREPGINDELTDQLRTCFPTSGLRADITLPQITDWLDAIDHVSCTRLRLLMTEMQSLAGTQPIVTILQALIKYYQLPDGHPDIQRFTESALTFDRSLTDFASHLLHYSDSIIYDPRAEAVTLCTLHAAKGLEFPLVFIAGLEDGILPFYPDRQTHGENEVEQLEEERRLLYVGLTRATTTLFLSWCKRRSRYGGPLRSCKPSRFLQELPTAAFTRPQVFTSTRIRSSIPRQLSLFS
ncbi:MAG: UvrD-helicase domain-containing protein [Desulfobulbus sp.]|nr:UvrD-helicase domain-containing protein [Desulfobulbus sp.]